MKPVLEENDDYRLVGRVKPLYFLKDEECLTYAQNFEIPFSSIECPFSKRFSHRRAEGLAPQARFREARILRNFAKSFIRIEEQMDKGRKNSGDAIIVVIRLPRGSASSVG